MKVYAVWDESGEDRELVAIMTDREASKHLSFKINTQEKTVNHDLVEEYELL